MQNQVGDVCIKTIEFYVKRLQTRKKDMDKSEKKAAKGEVNEADIDKERILYTKFSRKTEKLLSFCFSLLYNLAEDLNIERKMVKRKIV